jgi:putative DNA primase/helicase
MSFENFAQSHGLIIKDLELNKWIRVPTTDHPHKRNGSYIFDGERGAVQNWAMHDKPVTWFSDTRVWVDDAEYKKKREAAENKKIDLQKKAASKGAWILKNSAISTHPYLTKKGFPDETGYVWNDLLVIPTRLDGKLTGCQLIAADGTKKFLSGQRTQGVYCGFDNKGMDILVEGYATALSVRRALKTARKRYKIWVCFSANNIITVSKGIKTGLVVADNDSNQTGIKAAIKTGLPYWVSDTEGEDANDYELRVGTKQLGDDLSSAIYSVSLS